MSGYNAGKIEKSYELSYIDYLYFFHRRLFPKLYCSHHRWDILGRQERKMCDIVEVIVRQYMNQLSGTDMMCHTVSWYYYRTGHWPFHFILSISCVPVFRFLQIIHTFISLRSTFFSISKMSSRSIKWAAIIISYFANFSTLQDILSRVLPYYEPSGLYIIMQYCSDYIRVC